MFAGFNRELDPSITRSYLLQNTPLPMKKEAVLSLQKQTNKSKPCRVVCAYRSSDSGGWYGRIVWAQELEITVSYDCVTALQSGWQSETLTQKKKSWDPEDKLGYWVKQTNKHKTKTTSYYFYSSSLSGKKNLIGLIYNPMPFIRVRKPKYY